MSQVVFDSINPATTSGTELATILDDFKDAVMSGFSGSTRPTETAVGGYWVDSAELISDNLLKYKFYDGTNDVEIFRVNTSTHQIGFAGAIGSSTITQVSADTVGAVINLVKRRIASSGQVADGDTVGEVVFKGRANDAADYVVAKMSTVASDAYTASAQGAYIVWSAIGDATATLVEMMRLVDGKLGIGTTAPDSSLHVSSTTGIKSGRASDNTSGAILSLEKARIASTGAVQSGDEIAVINFRAQDADSAKFTTAQIKTYATENHTGSAKGTSHDFLITRVGQSSMESALVIGDVIESKLPHLSQAIRLGQQDVATSASITGLSASKAIVNFTGSTETQLHGIDASGSTRAILLHNSSTANIVLNSQSVTEGTAGNRFNLPETLLTVAAKESVELFYNTTSSRWELKSGTSGGGSSSGGINYILNPSSDSDTTGWTTFADAAAATPVDLTGGSPNSTWTRSTSTPLRGTASFLWTKNSGASRQGEGVSYDFTIDAADKGKMLGVSFDYLVASGTYLDNALQVWIYDVTNAVLIQPAPTNILNTGVPATWSGVFQAAINSTSYRVGLYVPVTTDSANTIQFDNFSVGPQTKSIGAFIEDFNSSRVFTLTNAGNATVSARTKMVGDHMIGTGTITMGSSLPTGSIILNMPAGMTIDTTKTTGLHVGAASGGNSGGTSSYTGSVRVDTASTLFFYGDSGASVWNATIPFTWANGSRIDFTFQVAITGKSSGMVLSSDADTRVVAARYNLTSSHTSNTTTPVRFENKVYDTHGMVSTYAQNATAWKATAPVKGTYVVSASAYNNGGSPTNMTIYKNGSQYASSNSTAVSATGVVTATLDLNAGDYFDLRFDTSNATGTNSLLHYIDIFRLSGPSQIAASESVNARYYNSSTSISSSLATVVWTTKDYDSHNAMSAGVYTVPISGKYSVKIENFHLATYTLNNLVYGQIQKNGTAVTQFTVYAPSAVTAIVLIGSDTINCIAGDTIRFQTADFGTTPTIGNSNLANYMTIERVGN